MKWRSTLALIILVGLNVPASAEVVLETDDDAATLTGSWVQSQAVVGFYGKDYATATGGGSADTARFFSQRRITTTGTWCVQAHWTAAANRTTAARYQVYDGATLRSTFQANQRINGGAWRRLGCTLLTAGRTAEVRLSDAGSAAGSQVVADGVRWVWEETSTQVSGNLCVALDGGFGNGGTTFVGQGFSVPPGGVCKPWSGIMKTASTVVGFSSGAGCTSSDGKVLTLSLQTTVPEFVGIGNPPVLDHIQLCTGGASACPFGVSQSHNGTFFSGTPGRVNCTAALVNIPSTHD